MNTLKIRERIFNRIVRNKGVVTTGPMSNADQPERWAVVQELLPFGYHIEKTFASESRARRYAACSRYLYVTTLALVNAENERLSNMDEFNRELERWSETRG
jgi:hypothetical protein